MAEPITLALARRWLRPRPRNAHKGTSGRVLVIAGSRGMVGAGILCASAAARSGAGLVKLATVKSQQTVAAKRAPVEITTLGLPEDSAGHLGAASLGELDKTISQWRPDVIALGPGLGVTAVIKRLVEKFIYSGRVPIVLDADGLNALAQLKVRKKSAAPLVLTPHLGELKRLRAESPQQAALRFNAVCLLKGPGTIVTDGRTSYRNTTGNPAMASGGMGDVLTGIIAASWAQGMVRLCAASFGAFLHGLAADIAVREFPERTLLASDVVAALPRAFKKIWRKI